MLDKWIYVIFRWLKNVPQLYWYWILYSPSASYTILILSYLKVYSENLLSGYTLGYFNSVT